MLLSLAEAALMEGEGELLVDCTLEQLLTRVGVSSGEDQDHHVVDGASLDLRLVRSERARNSQCSSAAAQRHSTGRGVR